MPVPNTGGQLRTSIAEMQVGDYIVCEFYIDAGWDVGSMRKLGTSTAIECPLVGISNTTQQTVSFYLIKVDKGLLIADRVVRHSVSWDNLNKWDCIQGAPKAQFSDNTFNGIVRSLGGGNSYAKDGGKSSTTDAELGAWPVDNEWDTYIVKKDYGTGAGRDDVWHSNIVSFSQETPVNGLNSVGTNSTRVGRGYLGAIKGIYVKASSYAGSDWGFRPVFEYQEV